MKKLSVLFISSTFPLNSYDSQAAWMKTFIHSLQRDNISVEVLAPAHRGSSSGVIDSIQVHRFRYAPKSLEFLTSKGGAISNLRNPPILYIVIPLYLLFGSIAAIQLMRSRKYDIVHVHWPFPNAIFGILSAKFHASKLIYTIYGAEFTLIDKLPFARNIGKYLLEKADISIAISSFTRRKTVSLVRKDVHVIPFSSGLDSNVSDAAQKIHKNRIKHILFVGRLIERKGVMYLIESIHHIVQYRTDIHCDIAGGCELFDVLGEKVTDMQLTSFITMHGIVSRNKLKNLYFDCTLVVLPSIIDRWGDTEGLGVVLLEAMDYGKPVVASRVGGLVDIVKHKRNGMLVPQKNPQKLARAVMYILDNDKRAENMGRNGKKFVLDHYSWGSIIQKTISLYRKDV